MKPVTLRFYPSGSTQGTCGCIRPNAGAGPDPSPPMAQFFDTLPLPAGWNQPPVTPLLREWMGLSPEVKVEMDEG